MMVNETKAKARVRALREVGKAQLAPRSARRLARGSHTDPIYTLFTITQHFRSFILPGNAPIELPAEEAKDGQEKRKGAWRPGDANTVGLFWKERIRLLTSDCHFLHWK